MFWLDVVSPVIVLSVRYDRIDWFWHTLAHEMAHISNNDLDGSIDSNLVGETRTPDLNEVEQRADRDGAEFLIPQESLKSFVLRIRPYFYKTKIVQFAKRINVHPGIVNGQLQHLKEIGWNTNREMLVKVKDVITTTALTDGWGQTPRIS
jgi:HTH-type transcriptional regulator/antitoxin HigA